jgi:hypothetical protein
MSNLAKWGYKAGVNGTVTLPVGAIVTHLRAEASAAATVTIFGGDSLALPGAAGVPSKIELGFGPTGDFKKTDPNMIMHGAPESKIGAQTIVFGSTTSYFVGYLYLPQKFERVVQDTIAIFDVSALSADFVADIASRKIQDVIALTDVLRRVANATRSNSDTAAVSDAASWSGNSKGPAEAILTSKAPGRTNYTPVPDPVVLAETVRRVCNQTRAPAGDTLAVTDSLTYTCKPG